MHPYDFSEPYYYVFAKIGYVSEGMYHCGLTISDIIVVWSHT